MPAADSRRPPLAATEAALQQRPAAAEPATEAVLAAVAVAGVLGAEQAAGTVPAPEAEWSSGAELTEPDSTAEPGSELRSDEYINSWKNRLNW